MTEAWIIDACRTPRGIGKVGKGALADIHPQQLGATVLKALKERNNLNTADVGGFRRALSAAFYRRSKERFGRTAWTLLEDAVGRLG